MTAAIEAAPAPRLRILLVVATFYPDSYGGAERQARILAEALGRRGVEVRIVAPTVRQDLPVSEPTAFGSVERVKVRHFPNLGGRKIGSTIAWTLAVSRRFAVPGQVDAVYVFHARLHVLPALLLSRRLDVPLMIKLGGGGEASDFEALRRKRYVYGKAVLRSVIEATDGFVANSEQIVRDLEALKTPAERIFAFPNGVAIPSSADFAAAATARTGRRFVFTGRMIVDKSVSVLFEAACALLARGLDLQLTFLGDGPERDRLVEEARALGYDDRIRFPGVCADVYPTLFESDFFVSASEREGQSNSLLEAMSAGCIPIVFGASGAGDLIDNGRTGLLAPRSDASSFTQAMEMALALTPDERRAMSRDVRAFTEETVGVDAVAARTEAVIEALIQRRRAA